MFLRPALQLAATLAHVRRRCRSVLSVVAVVAAVVAGGCESSAITSSPTLAKCQLSLAAPSTVDASGGTGIVTITTQPECGWDVSTTANWITGLSPTSGQGTGQVAFQVAPNQAASPREGDIVVNGDYVRVSQAVPCRIQVGPASQNMNAGGGAGIVNVTATSGCSWTAASDVNWISLTAPVTGNGNGTVTFNVAPNGGNGRTGTVMVADQTSTVTQAGVTSPGPTSACTYTITPTSQSAAATGSVGAMASISTGTGCAWTAGSNVAWIIVTSGSTGSGNGSVTFDVVANTGAARNGTLTIAGQTFSVTQAAASAPTCTYTITPTSQNVGAAGSVGTVVTVSTATGCAWTAGSNVAWIIVTSGSSGSGNGSVTFDVAANTGAAQNGTLTIAGQTFSVTQAAASAPTCTYSIAPTSQSVAGGASTATVSVSTASGCMWTATSNTSWITITSGASGTGSGTVQFDVQANPGKKKRSGTLTVAGRTAKVDQP